MPDDAKEILLKFLTTADTAGAEKLLGTTEEMEGVQKKLLVVANAALQIAEKEAIIAGDDVKLKSIKEQQRVLQLTVGLMKQYELSAEDAGQMAEKLADLEKRAAEATEARAKAAEHAAEAEKKQHELKAGLKEAAIESFGLGFLTGGVAAIAARALGQAIEFSTEKIKGMAEAETKVREEMEKIELATLKAGNGVTAAAESMRELQRFGTAAAGEGSRAAAALKASDEVVKQLATDFEKAAAAARAFRQAQDELTDAKLSNQLAKIAQAEAKGEVGGGISHENAARQRSEARLAAEKEKTDREEKEIENDLAEREQRAEKASADAEERQAKLEAEKERYREAQKAVTEAGIDTDATPEKAQEAINRIKSEAAKEVTELNDPALIAKVGEEMQHQIETVEELVKSYHDLATAKAAAAQSDQTAKTLTSELTDAQGKAGPKLEKLKLDRETAEVAAGTEKITAAHAEEKQALERQIAALNAQIASLKKGREKQEGADATARTNDIATAEKTKVDLERKKDALEGRALDPETYDERKNSADEQAKKYLDDRKRAAQEKQHQQEVKTAAAEIKAIEAGLDKEDVPAYRAKLEEIRQKKKALIEKQVVAGKKTAEEADADYRSIDTEIKGKEDDAETAAGKRAAQQEARDRVERKKEFDAGKKNRHGHRKDETFEEHEDRMQRREENHRAAEEANALPFDKAFPKKAAAGEEAAGADLQPLDHAADKTQELTTKIEQHAAQQAATLQASINNTGTNISLTQSLMALVKTHGAELEQLKAQIQNPTDH